MAPGLLWFREKQGMPGMLGVTFGSHLDEQFVFNIDIFDHLKKISWLAGLGWLLVWAWTTDIYVSGC